MYKKSFEHCTVMASTDTDSSSSSSDDRAHKHKKRSKQKHHKKKHRKKEKKSKHGKHKKRARRSSSSSSSSHEFEPKRVMLPMAPAVALQNAASATEQPDAFGPALPPHLLQRSEPTPMIGPIMPSDWPAEADKAAEQSKLVKVAANQELDVDEDDAADTFGPLPLHTQQEKPLNATQLQLEERALQLKLAAMGGGSLNVTDEQKVREEWMLELPDVGLKGGLAALSNMKRTFHQGREKPDFTDRSMWTKTPQDAENAAVKPVSAQTKAETLKQRAEAYYQRQRDEEQERLASKHKKKHKREESLVELHQQKLRKEQRQKAKELAAAGAKPERRPFSREVDLKLNKIDKHQTKSIVDKAKMLNSKFASGHTKYL